MTKLHEPETSAEPDQGPDRLYFPTLEAFVRDYICQLFRHRRIDGIRTFWAADWWRYDEACVRLDAMWRAWEHLRLDPTTGPSTWLRDHADPHMTVLMAPTGPFGGATEPEHTTTRGQHLPYQSPPTGMFPPSNPPEWQSQTTTS